MYTTKIRQAREKRHNKDGCSYCYLFRDGAEGTAEASWLLPKSTCISSWHPSKSGLPACPAVRGPRDCILEPELPGFPLPRAAALGKASLWPSWHSPRCPLLLRPEKKLRHKRRRSPGWKAPWARMTAGSGSLPIPTSATNPHRNQQETDLFWVKPQTFWSCCYCCFGNSSTLTNTEDKNVPGWKERQMVSVCGQPSHSRKSIRPHSRNGKRCRFS